MEGATRRTAGVGLGPEMGPAKSPIQRVLDGSFPGRVKRRGVKLSTYFHLLPKLRMVEMLTYYPNTLLEYFVT
jgi:hypothetical protein